MRTELGDWFDALSGHEELLRAIGSGNERVAEPVAYTHIESDRRDSLATLRRLGID